MIILSNTYSRKAATLDDVALYNQPDLKTLISKKNDLICGTRVSATFRPSVTGLDAPLSLSLTKEELQGFAHFAISPDSKSLDPGGALAKTILYYARLASSRLENFPFVKEESARYYSVAFMKYLVGNRLRRDRLNDFVLGVILARECYTTQDTFLGGPTICVGTGYGPDLDRDKKDLRDLSVGMGSRHTASWHETGKYLGLKGSLLTDHDRVARYALGAFPWWLQGMLMALDVQRKSVSASWLRNPIPVGQSDVAVGAYYPYWILEQPGLHRASFRSLESTRPMKSVQKWFESLKIPGSPSFVDWLKYGVPADYSGSFLFKGLTGGNLGACILGATNFGAFSVRGGGTFTSTYALSADFDLVSNEVQYIMNQSPASQLNRDARTAFDERAQRRERSAVPLIRNIELS